MVGLEGQVDMSPGRQVMWLSLDGVSLISTILEGSGIFVKWTAFVLGEARGF